VRRDPTLTVRYEAILSYTGLVLLLAGLMTLTPLLALLSRPSEWPLAPWFIGPSLILLAAGAALWRLLRPKQPVTLNVADGGVIVLLSWVTVFLVSAVPFLGIESLNFTQAVFESVSGWTTTGLTVVDVESAPHLILLWRSVMQLGGGAGLAIIMVAALAGPSGPGLYEAEGRGEQLVPHVRESARLVVTIYSGYAVLGILAYCLAGMTLFEAVNHAFTAVSTGGFSTSSDSIGHWDSLPIEVVTLVLMLLGSLNFVTAYVALKGRWGALWRNGELRVPAVLVPICFALLLATMAGGLYAGAGKTVRVAIFETVTAITTTGFSTTNYGQWAGAGWIVLILLMLIGGGTCSTAGGIKQYRVYVLCRGLVEELRRPFLPEGAVIQTPVWRGERKGFLNDAQVRRVGTFVFLYLAAFAAGSLIIATHGHGLKESCFEFASALGTVGLSVGITAADAPQGVLWTEIAGMFLGRLEFFIILVSIGKIARDAWHLAQARPSRPAQR